MTGSKGCQILTHSTSAVRQYMLNIRLKETPEPLIMWLRCEDLLFLLLQHYATYSQVNALQQTRREGC